MTMMTSLYRACKQARVSTLSSRIIPHGTPLHQPAKTAGLPRAYAAKKAAAPKGRMDTTPEAEGPENLLEGKRTRKHIHTAFNTRCADALRYEYYAQRADIECETDAALTFRSLSESAKQQAMGYLELMEEYGDVNFGSTMENLDVAAGAERTLASDVLRDAGVIAGEEGLTNVEEFFEDMTDAGHRAAFKLDAIQGIIEEEMMEDTEMGGDIDDILPGKKMG